MMFLVSARLSTTRGKTNQEKVPGFDTPVTNNLRLWSSKAASGEFDFQKFNSGDYESAVGDEQRAETISAVLYPNDK